MAKKIRGDRMVAPLPCAVCKSETSDVYKFECVMAICNADGKLEGSGFTPSNKRYSLCKECVSGLVEMLDRKPVSSYQQEVSDLCHRCPTR